MNAFTLKELVKRRVPGYDDTEYLSEINDVYEEIWGEIQQIDEMYFADINILTTTQQTDTFDLVWNMYGSLDSSLPRLHQIHRIRIQQPQIAQNVVQGFQPVSWTHPSDPEYMGRQTQPTGPRTTPSYPVVPFGNGSLKFAEPLPVGCQLEVWYTFKVLDLQILSQGAITTNGNQVIGSGTNFTQLVPADLLAYLPGFGNNAAEAQVGAEIIIFGQAFRVTQILNDTTLTCEIVPLPITAQPVPYILASVPDFPPSLHRMIATLATRNILTTPAEDERFATWAAMSQQSVERMKNTLIQRQRQEPPRKERFPYGTTRRARFFGVK